MPPEVETAWTVYEKAGLAGLFLLMYLFTVGYLIRSLVRQQKEGKEETAMIVHALESSTAMNEKCADLMDRVSTATEQQSRALSEFIAWMKGREGR
jgi:hypothetical protein